jgi:hypothetical protein
MRRASDFGEDNAPAARKAKKRKRRDGGAAGGAVKAAASGAAAAAACGPGATLAECGFALRHGLLSPDDCVGFRGDAGGACAACGRSPAAHAAVDERAGGGGGGEAATMRAAWLALRETRALGYSGAAGTPLEDSVRAQRRRMLTALQSAAGALARARLPAVAARVREAITLLPAAADAPVAAVATLRLAALCDDAVAELYIADAGAGGAAGVPPPHAYLATLVARGSGACSECAPAAAPGGPLCEACAAANPQLAYLRLRHAEAAGPLALRRLAAAALAAEGAAPGPPDGTMRGTDPLGCDTLRVWQAAVRDRVAAWSAFACPDAAAARALAAFAGGRRVVEVAAGTGFWAWLLAARGVHVEAFDSRPPQLRGAAQPGGGAAAANEYHGALPAWARVQPGDAAAVAARHGAGDAAVLLLCYAPPGGAMALAALRAFAAAGGRRLALVGETRGDTGGPQLERELAAHWVLARAALPLPNYANTVATLTLWERRRDAGAAAAPKAWPLACAGCGALPPAAGAGPLFLRDRLTRAVVACGWACARGDAATRALEAELAARHLPPLRRAPGAPKHDWTWQDAGAQLPLWRAQVSI